MLDKWRFYLKDLESPDSFIDWGFYFLISSALQRRIWLNTDTFMLFPNMYVVLCGPPAVGKSRVINQVAEIIKSPEMLFINKQGVPTSLLHYGADSVTLEAMLRDMAMNPRSITYEIVDNDGNKKTKTYAHYSCVYMIEELGVLLRKNTDDMVNVLTALYDSRNLRYKTKHQGEDNLINVCVCLIAGTTPSFIKQAINSELISQGFTSRFVFVCESGPRFFRQFPGITEEQRKAHRDIVEHVKKLTKIVGRVELSKEAEEYHREVYESGKLLNDRVNKDEKLDYYYGRKNVHWLKLSMVLHFSNQTDNFVIQKETMEKALTVLNKTEVNMSMAFRLEGKNPWFGDLVRITDIVGKEPGISVKQLWIKTVDNLDKESFNNCLEYLVKTDQIVIQNDRIFPKTIEPTP